MSIFTAFRCPEDILAKAKVKAAGERRSLSNYIITLIAKDLGVVRIPTKKKRKG